MSDFSLPPSGVASVLVHLGVSLSLVFCFSLSSSCDVLTVFHCIAWVFGVFLFPFSMCSLKGRRLIKFMWSFWGCFRDVSFGGCFRKFLLLPFWVICPSICQISWSLSMFQGIAVFGGLGAAIFAGIFVLLSVHLLLFTWLSLSFCFMCLVQASVCFIGNGVEPQKVSRIKKMTQNLRTNYT